MKLKHFTLVELLQTTFFLLTYLIAEMPENKIYLSRPAGTFVKRLH